MTGTLTEGSGRGTLEDGTAFWIDGRDNVFEESTGKPLGKLTKGAGGWTIEGASGEKIALSSSLYGKPSQAAGLGAEAAAAPTSPAPTSPSTPTATKELPIGPDGKIQWLALLAPLLGAGVGAAIGGERGAMYGAQAGASGLKGFTQGLSDERDWQTKEQERLRRAGLETGAENRAVATAKQKEDEAGRVARGAMQTERSNAIDEWLKGRTDSLGILSQADRDYLDEVTASKAATKIKEQEVSLFKMNRRPDGTPIPYNELTPEDQARIDQMKASATASLASAAREPREPQPQIVMVEDPETFTRYPVQIMPSGQPGVPATGVRIREAPPGLGGPMPQPFNAAAAHLRGEDIVPPPPISRTAAPTDTASVVNELKQLLATAKIRPLTDIEKARVMELRQSIGR